MKHGKVPAITTSAARGTPATPLLVSMRTSNMVTCVPRDKMHAVCLCNKQAMQIPYKACSHPG